jgi:hypothetical protein
VWQIDEVTKNDIDKNMQIVGVKVLGCGRVAEKKIEQL